MVSSGHQKFSTMFDPILSFWILLWMTITSYGLYLFLTDDKRASSFYLYGKSLDATKKKGLFWQLFLLPKRYFTHFYITAVLVFVSSFAITILCYVPSNLKPEFNSFVRYINSLIGEQFKIETATTLTSVISLVFTLILMIIQSSRRLYETLFISVYSKDSKINIIHYIFGHSFYIAAAASTICPIVLSPTSSKYSISTILDNLVTTKRALIFVLFIYVSHYQHRCNKILANLRKDKTGRVITGQHFVPSGGLFELVSCPHFLTEVVLYFLITVIQEFGNTYWNLIFILVLSTQTINAVNEHKWYKGKYSDYPKERKAIFPKLL